MIRVTSIRKCRSADYDDVYLIVRSIASLERSKSGLLKQATHVPDLSPSKALFFKYLDWRKTGDWNVEKFNSEYRPIFTNEIVNNTAAQMWLNKIETESKAGRKIALLCFCDDEATCHRSIIGEMLKNKGCDVVFDKTESEGNNI